MCAIGFKVAVQCETGSLQLSLCLERDTSKHILVGKGHFIAYDTSYVQEPIPKLKIKFQFEV